MTVPEIVASVIAGYRGRIPAPAAHLTGAHRSREYIVQYGETDHEFISRLLAEDGIVSFFHHA